MHTGDGFVAIADINPLAPVHLLVPPERHVDTFRDVTKFPDEAQRMLAFVAEPAAAAGLTDRVVVNVGPDEGQDGLPPSLARAGRTPMTLITRIEEDVKEATLARDGSEARCAAPHPREPPLGREGHPATTLGGRGAPGAPAGAQAQGRGGGGVPRPLAGGRLRPKKEEGELAILEEFMPRRCSPRTSWRRSSTTRLRRNGGDEHP